MRLPLISAIAANLIALVLLLPATIQASPTWAEFNRLYQGSNGDHLYTTNLSEVSAAENSGSVWEGFIGYVRTASESGTEPLYRAYNQATGEHFYTTSLNEYNSLNGWNKEGIGAYTSSSSSDTLPLYRFYINSKHLYTTSEAEKASLISQGKTYEGIATYLYKISPEMTSTRHWGLRLSALDQGKIFNHGLASDGSDEHGARDVFVYKENNTFYMTYDGASDSHWSGIQANSTDLTNWNRLGEMSELKESQPGTLGYNAFYGTIYKTATDYKLFYIGTTNQQAPPENVPTVDYTTMLAHSSSPTGPWVKDHVAIAPTPNTYYSKTCSPGSIVQNGSQYMMFVSVSKEDTQGNILRTIGIARTNDLDGQWTVDSQPVFPQTAQLENASIYYQASSGTYFMFVNHVGRDQYNNEYTDGILVYWTQDINSWNDQNGAVVVDGQVSNWSKQIIGSPWVVEHNGKLAVFYDGRLAGLDYQNPIKSHMDRDIGVAWVNLPIQTP